VSSVSRYLATIDLWDFDHIIDCQRLEQGSVGPVLPIRTAAGTLGRGNRNCASHQVFADGGSPDTLCGARHFTNQPMVQP